MKNAKQTPTDIDEENLSSSEGHSGVESTSIPGDSAGRTGGRPPSRGSPSSDDGGTVGEDSEGDEHPLRGRSRPGISGSSNVGDPVGDLLQAFQEGDPEAAYRASKVLISEYERTLTEIAKFRYRVNFGSERCESCEGLRAGPDVLATCFDLKQCHFTNLKRGDEDPRHLHVIQSLFRKDSS